MAGAAVAHPEPTLPERRLALVGPGRAGGAVAGALVARGWRVVGVAGRHPDAPGVVAAAARLDSPRGEPAAVVVDADLVVLATPDAAIDELAAAIAPAVRSDALVIHLSGARGLEALAGIPARVGALHPLQTLPDPERGAARLDGAYAAIAGDGEVEEIARALGMTPFTVPDADRASYHAAACIASNHLVALLAQVEAVTDVPVAAFLPLVHATVDNVGALGTRAALTGPVARGDAATVRAHRDAIPDSEQDAYVAMARRTAALAGRDAELGEALT